MLALARQFLSFFGVGLAATAAHYAVLVALVEAGGARPLPATLAGYVVGGVVSYVLLRRHTYRSERPHAEATWRFALVAAGGFLATAALMHALVDRLGAPYLPAQIAVTGVLMLWSFFVHKVFSFRA